MLPLFTFLRLDPVHVESVCADTTMSAVLFTEGSDVSPMTYFHRPNHVRLHFKADVCPYLHGFILDEQICGYKQVTCSINSNLTCSVSTADEGEEKKRPHLH